MAELFIARVIHHKEMVVALSPDNLQEDDKGNVSLIDIREGFTEANDWWEERYSDWACDSSNVTREEILSKITVTEEEIGDDEWIEQVGGYDWALHGFLNADELGVVPTYTGAPRNVEGIRYLWQHLTPLQKRDMLIELKDSYESMVGEWFKDE